MYLAVLTAAAFIAHGLKPIPHQPWSPHPAETKLHNSGGRPPFEAPHFPLPTDKARFVGEAVAMIIAETVHAAKDGAEHVEVIYEVLPAVVATAAAARRTRRMSTMPRSRMSAFMGADSIDQRNTF